MLCKFKTYLKIISFHLFNCNWRTALGNTMFYLLIKCEYLNIYTRICVYV